MKEGRQKKEEKEVERGERILTYYPAPDYTNINPKIISFRGLSPASAVPQLFSIPYKCVIQQDT